MRGRLLRDGFVILAFVFVLLRLFAVRPWADSVDAFAYWTTRDGAFYDDATTGRIGGVPLLAGVRPAPRPAVWLPLAVFTAIWTAVNCAAVWFLVRRWALPSLLFVPIAFEIVSGNVHLLYAAAIVIGFRWPAAWALMLLTKVTPGVGVLWFLVRRQWRALAVAVGATAVIAAVSFALDRPQWIQWIDLLRTDAAGAAGGSFETVGWYVPIALAPRLVVAVAIVVLAALTDRRWLLPFAVVLAMPVLWLNSFATLAAVPALLRARETDVGRIGSPVRRSAAADRFRHLGRRGRFEFAGPR